MEQRANKKITAFMNDFKSKIILNHTEMTDNNFKNFIDDYELFQLTAEDFIKRKRVKNFVPKFDRCIARRANNEQCTRRKKDNCSFCGTHQKGQPHGIITNSDKDNYVETKIEINTQDINGIIYYIDANNNVYDPQDILNGKTNPQIISKYEKKDGKFYIINIK